MNYYIYRLPGKREIVFGGSNRLLNEPTEDCFAISEFEPIDAKTYFIPNDLPDDDILWNLENSNPYIPTESTTKEQHIKNVNSVIENISNGELRKCVISRVIISDLDFDIKKLFYALEFEYPDAFVFCFSTEKTGTWIGASPELLLECHNKQLHTVALAGTRRAYSNQDWDSKNIEEQLIVSQYIASCLENYTTEVNVGKRYTQRAGGVEHIKTDITATLPDSHDGYLVAKELSPTPALSGMPKESAIRMIDDLELHHRGCYGGFCGPYQSKSDFRFFVNLRSLTISNNKYAIYSGGGIMSESDPDNEWDETESKSDTLLSIIKGITK